MEKLTLNIGKKFPEITGPAVEVFVKELAKIEDSEYQEVILDFSKTNAISSIAMGSLYSTFRALQKQNRKLKIVNPNDNILRLLQLINMTDML